MQSLSHSVGIKSEEGREQRDDASHESSFKLRTNLSLSLSLSLSVCEPQRHRHHLLLLFKFEALLHHDLIPLPPLSGLDTDKPT